MATARRTTKRRRRLWWEGLPFDELMGVRLCDLELTIEGSPVEPRVDRLNRQLQRRGLRFRPHVWLSSDWFTPDGVPGFAVPFFLAHPRLARIEHRHMLEIEGGAHSWCMRLLRHEAGHAIDNAYRLHWKKRWREVFGPFSQPYRQTYQPLPESKEFVQNLDFWYSQSHPAEDWAECFAVWLEPGAGWRSRYAGWPVLKKLEFVDELMREIADAPLKVRNRRREDSLPRLRMTLAEYYDSKQRGYRIDADGIFDEHVERLFASGQKRLPTAASFLRRNRQHLRARVSAVTGHPRYVVDQALREMIASAKRGGLRLARSERQTKVDASILLASLTIGLVSGRPREFVR